MSSGMRVSYVSPLLIAAVTTLAVALPSAAAAQRVEVFVNGQRVTDVVINGRVNGNGAVNGHHNGVVNGYRNGGLNGFRNGINGMNGHVNGANGALLMNGNGARYVNGANGRRYVNGCER
jgi:hypothetical protein